VPPASPNHRSLWWLMAGAASIVAVAAFAQIAAGSYEMSSRQSLAALTDANAWHQPAVLVRLLFGDRLAHACGLPDAEPLATTTLIVWNVRLPRVLVGLLVGINLACAGSIFQAVTRNELASPYLLGVSSGAGLAILGRTCRSSRCWAARRRS